ncbi:hypothetical protein [Streptomyces sp. NPDC058548]|uniref:hypothetical protein n=1 Tax=Streptomyces sp. NPDC058548 TaxID=3346545 RepID=UPI0036468ECB
MLWVAEGDRGVNAFLTFGPDGRAQQRIDSTGDGDGDGYGSIGAEVSVSDGRLFALTSGGRWSSLVAFDLASGCQLWRTELGGVDALLPYKDLVIVGRSGGNVRPFSAYEWW